MFSNSGKRNAGGVTLLVALALGAGACGDSSDDAKTTTRASAADFERMLVQANEEPGWEHASEPWTEVGVEAFAKSGPGLPKGEAQALRKVGFVSFSARRLMAPDSAGISNVHVFATPEGAQRWMTRELSTATIHRALPGVKITRFTVPGVPGAAGWSAKPKGMPPVANVAWVQGRCMLLLGNQSPHAMGGALATGVRSIHQRTKGECP